MATIKYEARKVTERIAEDTGDNYCDVEVAVVDSESNVLGRAVVSVEPTGEPLNGSNGWGDRFGWRGAAVEGADREEMAAVAGVAAREECGL